MSSEPEPSSGSPAEPGVDQRSGGDRRGKDRRQRAQAVPVERRKGTERRARQRRARSMNQYDLDAEVMEFIQAIGRFKERTGRPFPTWSEVLGILKDLGYEKRS